MSHACILISTEHACIENATSVCICLWTLKSVCVCVCLCKMCMAQKTTIAQFTAPNPTRPTQHAAACTLSPLRSMPVFYASTDCATADTRVRMRDRPRMCVCFKRSITLFKWNAPPPQPTCSPPPSRPTHTCVDHSHACHIEKPHTHTHTFTHARRDADAQQARCRQR